VLFLAYSWQRDDVVHLEKHEVVVVAEVKPIHSQPVHEQEKDKVSVRKNEKN